MKQLLLTCLLFCVTTATVTAQEIPVDSIRRIYGIPELAFAVVSSESVIALEVTGVKNAKTQLPAERTDLFRIGSNTKAVTGFLAAQLVQQGKISWETRFFDLFPELKTTADSAYYSLTLQDLLTFRTRLPAYTYTDKKPKQKDFTGTAEEQRYAFTAWFFGQPPVPETTDSMHFSNLGYVAAGLMLEKVSGQSYKELVGALGETLGIHFAFGQPNTIAPDQPWGHDAKGKPAPPQENYKLEWLLPAGNITLSLPDYAQFIQLQLRGLNGKSDLLPRETFHFLHFGTERFAVGWFWLTDDDGLPFSYNIGNPGTFLSKVVVFPGIDKAFILLANVQSDAASEGMDVLFDLLYKKYH